MLRMTYYAGHGFDEPFRPCFCGDLSLAEPATPRYEVWASPRPSRLSRRVSAHFSLDEASESAALIRDVGFRAWVKVF
jgi:hypothetical protein